MCRWPGAIDAAILVMLYPLGHAAGGLIFNKSQRSRLWKLTVVLAVGAVVCFVLLHSASHELALNHAIHTSELRQHARSVIIGGGSVEVVAVLEQPQLVEDSRSSPSSGKAIDSVRSAAQHHPPAEAGKPVEDLPSARPPPPLTPIEFTPTPRWWSLLSTLKDGVMMVNRGPQASIPSPTRRESVTVHSVLS